MVLAGAGNTPKSRKRRHTGGLTFGKYLLDSRIARGGMSEVWLARDNSLQGENRVVIKTVLSHLAEHQEFLELFDQEAQTILSLDHPNIVRCLDIGEVEGCRYIVMEYVRGWTLRHLQNTLHEQQKIMPQWLLFGIAASVCSALSHAHNTRSGLGEDLGIIHCDVSPENIMVSDTGRTKLLDFGVSQAASRSGLPQRAGPTGKLAYLAPEQVSSRATGGVVDRRTDVYALGVLLYEMLTCIQPFQASNDMALVLKIPREVPAPPARVARWVPARLSEVVMKAIAKKPEERYQTVDELCGELLSCRPEREPEPSEERIAKYMNELFGPPQTPPPVRRSSAPPALFRPLE